MASTDLQPMSVDPSHVAMSARTQNGGVVTHGSLDAAPGLPAHAPSSAHTTPSDAPLVSAAQPSEALNGSGAADVQRHTASPTTANADSGHANTNLGSSADGATDMRGERVPAASGPQLDTRGDHGGAGVTRADAMHTGSPFHDNVGGRDVLAVSSKPTKEDIEKLQRRLRNIQNQEKSVIAVLKRGSKWEDLPKTCIVCHSADSANVRVYNVPSLFG